MNKNLETLAAAHTHTCIRLTNKKINKVGCEYLLSEDFLGGSNRLGLALCCAIM